MDIKKIERSYSRDGRNEYPPRILLKVMIYAYMRMIYSSREIERACRENVCFMYLLGDCPVPDHNTIARFRAERLQGLEKELLEQFVELLAEWGFVSLATVFIDGTEIEANANRYSFVWKKSTEKKLTKLRAQIGKEMPGLVQTLGIKWHIPEEAQIHHLKKLRKKLYARAEAKQLEWVTGKGHRKFPLQKAIETVNVWLEKWKKYTQDLHICGDRKDFELFTPCCEFTDDTVMTCAVAQALMDSKEDFSNLSEKTVAAMQRIGRQYPNCGYGARFIHWMFTDDPQPYNSCGIGSAMRVSPVGFVARDVEEAKHLSAAVTCISHDHPEGMKGAEATAVDIVMARQGKSKEEIREEMEKYYDLNTSVDTYRKEWDGHGKKICQVTVPQALACFFEGNSYEDVIRNCISIGGDSDTIGAIAGGIAEAFYGVPEHYVEMARGYLDTRLLQILDEFEKWRE